MCVPGEEMRDLTFGENPQLKIISILNYKHWYLIHTWSDKAFDGTVVNRASLLGGSLEITLTVPLIIDIKITLLSIYSEDVALFEFFFTLV